MHNIWITWTFGPEILRDSGIIQPLSGHPYSEVGAIFSAAIMGEVPSEVQ